MKKTLFALIACAVASTASAQVTVSTPWARATVPVQKASGAFMVLRSAKDARLVEATSPVAERVEMHKSSMADGMMKMEQVDAIELPAGKDVALASGGYHLMLVGLKRQLKEGETVPLTLWVAGAGKQRDQVKVEARVQPLAYSAPHAGH